MATENGSKTDPLIEQVAEHGPKFDFFQAVRLLQLLDSDGPPVGHALQPSAERVRFRSHASFAHPASTIQEIATPEEGDGPVEIAVNFMGLASPWSRGSLPSWYTRLLLEQTRERNLAMRDFFDLFNHRLVSFYFRAWEKHSFPLHYEVMRGGMLHQLMYSVIGLGTSGMKERLAVDDRALLFHIGKLTRTPPSAEDLESMLSSYLGLPVEVLQFQPARYPLDPSDRLNLGDESFRLGSNTCLGDDVVLAQCKFRLRIGPLAWDDYQDLLPGGERYQPLADLVRFAVGPEFEFDVQPVLQASEVPEIQFDSSKPQHTRLGWSTWLGTRVTTRDADEAVVPVSLLEETKP